MKHLGDITKIDGHTAPVVDVVIGGSPCQDLSVAGRRAGLAGERSGLFMEQIRIVKEMREEERKRGRTGNAIRPRFMVWENVPGAFSSNKGQDFKAVLEEIIRIAEPDAPDIPLPPKGKWPLADAYYGDGWSVAYRVLDAQFWGVPQRRRRIALVADFGGHAAPEILFVRSGVQGGPPEVGSAGEETAVAPGFGPATAIALRVRAGCAGGGKGPLLQVEKSGTLGCNNDQTIFQVSSVICMATQQGGAEIRCDDKAPTLTAAAGMSGNNQPVICLCMATGQTGTEITENIAPTLNCNHEQPIICLMDQGGNVMDVLFDKTGTLRAQEHGHQPVICLAFPEDVANTLLGKAQLSHRLDEDTLVLAFKAGNGAKAGGLGIQNGVSPTLTSAESGTNQVPVVLFVDGYNQTTSDTAGTLRATKADGDHVGMLLTATEDGTILLDGKPCVLVKLLVRRLTPLECERLQGYPDGWTDIGPWVDSNGKFHKESSDSARYKALGNSIALPPWKWILKRISAIYEREATMASLFDGIGGFPLIWEQLNGKGSCLWASEIEPFPVAVTRYRFGDED